MQSYPGAYDRWSRLLLPSTVQQPLQGDPGDEDAPADADAGNLAAGDGVVGGRPGDAEHDCSLLDSNGEPLDWPLLDDRPDSPSLDVQLVPLGDSDGFAEGIRVCVPPVQLGDRDAPDGLGASKLGKVEVGLAYTSPVLCARGQPGSVPRWHASTPGG